MVTWTKLRAVSLLAAAAVALVVMKPILEALEAHQVTRTKQPTLNATAQTTGPTTPDASRVIVEEPLQVLSLEVTSAVFDGVPVRLYRPTFNTSKKNSLPVVVYFHGGGWIQGSIDSLDPYTRKISMKTGLLVISVEYRLAPQHPFPIPLDDCHKAVLYVHKHASELRADASKIMLMGDSAGGNLAAAVSQRMKDVKPPLLAQILIHPVMQCLSFQLPSDQAYGADWLLPMFPSYFLGVVDTSLTAAMLAGSHVSDQVRQRYSPYIDYRKLPESFLKGYVAPQRVKTDPSAAKVLEPFIINAEINPLMSQDLKGLPHSMVVTAGLDSLRDDGVFYAIRLKEAGVPLLHAHYDDSHHVECINGGETPPGSVASRTNSDIFEFIHSRISRKKHAP